MKPFKFVFSHKPVKVWFIVTAIVLVLVLAVSLVITQVTFIRGTFDVVFGKKRAVVTENTGAYTGDYDSKSDVLAAANDFNVSIAEEGTILLKNDASLPLAQGAGISVFGKNSVKLVLGGSGSGNVSGAEAKTIYDSLDAAGFKVNPTLKSFYQGSESGSGRAQNPSIGANVSGFGTGETPISSYNANVKASYGADSEYKDAALVVISRIGGEGIDLPRTMQKSAGSPEKIEGARNADDHYLQLDANETALLQEVCENFDNVIVIINSSSAMELGFLDDPDHYAYHENIKGALWVGSPGGTGIMALGKILNGDVNPSGHTIDTYARDFKQDPTWSNFGNNRENNGNRYNVDGTNKNAYFVDYEEGIYVGYRYYETRGYTEEQAGNADWYQQHVVFPFGYGQSYTSFDWEIESISHPDGAVLAQDDEITVRVKVINTGDYDGKDVVQLYYTPPYTTGGIEKAHVVLGAFEKTQIIEKQGNSDVVELTFKVGDMRSYDYDDANNNGHKGYEIEAGTYEIKLAKNAHDVFATYQYTIAEDILITNDEETGYPIENRFDDVSGQIVQYLSRNDWDGTWPTTPTADDLSVSQTLIDAMDYKSGDEGQPWYTTEMPARTEQNAETVLFDLVGKDYDDPLWDSLLDRLTYQEMAMLIGVGAYGTGDIEKINKPKTIEPDGPGGFTAFMGGPEVYDTCAYVAECVVGATWNKELAEAMGEMVGNEALIGYEKGDGLPYSGWYAPAVNIHRSPFGGRNWEYYSEDPMLSGALGAAVCQGAMNKGVYTYVKHLVANEQETSRDSNGLITWLNEQALRELYLKPFEMTVKEGGTTGMMSSFNRIGTTWTGGSYPLLTEVLRSEWGFRGTVITDYALKEYLNSEQMIRTGGDLVLTQGGKIPQYDNISAIQASSLRRAAKNILYTTANSNAMNTVIDHYRMPVWQEVLIAADCAIVLLLAVWGFVVIRKAKKKDKAAA